MPTEECTTDEEFEAVYIRRNQIRPSPPIRHTTLEPILQTYPPLAQVTVLDHGKVEVKAVLEVPASRILESWEVSLWQSTDESEWKEVSLMTIPGEALGKELQELPDSIGRIYFSTHYSLSFINSVKFTAKFRCSADAEWTWIRDHGGFGDGMVLFKTIDSTDVMEPLLKKWSANWEVSEANSQSPKSRLWVLGVDVPGSEDDQSGTADILVQTPRCLRWFALVRQWSPWLVPRHGKSEFSLDKDALMCTFLCQNGRYVVFLAVSAVTHVCSVLRTSSDGQLFAHARSEATYKDEESKCIILAAESSEFDNAVAAVMYEARALVVRGVGASKADEALGGGEIKPQWFENWYDGLGYCTWNGLGQRLTEEGIVTAMDKLAAHDIQVTNLIIDDNWQSLDGKASNQFQRGMTDFEADPECFPGGLKSMVSQLKTKHPGLHNITVWHAILGYWGGISSTGELSKAYKTVELDCETSTHENIPINDKVTVIAKEDVSRFYNDFYRFLTDSGINSIKTDAQFMMDLWANSSSRRELISEYLDAWSLSSLRHFGMKAISCMSHFPHAIFHSHMKQSRPAYLIRSSDDFFPCAPESHPWHVWANAHNCILLQHLNVLPDWDMFQTAHEYSGFHSAARCVSGGPIYITDTPGQHNIDLIRQMTGKTVRGNTVTFRPSVVGKSVSPFVGYDDNALLRIATYHGRSQTGTSILALFNVSKQPLVEFVQLVSFSGADPSSKHVIRAHSSGKVSRPTSLDDQSSTLFTISLSVLDYEILCAFPVKRLSSRRHGPMYFANLGLVGKMTGCAAIMHSITTERENGLIVVDTNLKALGTLGLYISCLPKMTIDENFMITIQGRPIPPHTVSKSGDDECVLEVDVETAWEEMGLDSGWSNEVPVKVIMCK